MRILVVGGGGREHALCWALSHSATVFCAPGNPGTAEVATNLAVSSTDLAGLVEAADEHAIDLSVVGPEAPLATGLVDRLVAAGHRAFGPTADAAQLEASKAYAKTIMERASVPTAACATFEDQAKALDYISVHPEPLVVKASGLAAGKGAIVCESRRDAGDAIRKMFAGKFGEAGRTVLVEEFLTGEELSVLALSDGENIMVLPPSQDHKRLEEGDRGPNTGGMGAYSPVSLVDDALLRRVEESVLCPVLTEMESSGSPYKGVLYAGLMISDSGEVKVLEFNCRFGDPEAQVVLPLVQTDLVDHMWRIASGEDWTPPGQLRPSEAAVTTVLASAGYPEAPQKGLEIALPGELPPATLLFHAGTTRDERGILRTAGGRVMCATGLGPDVSTAAERSRGLAASIDFDGRVYRGDIAWREVARAGAT